MSPLDLETVIGLEVHVQLGVDTKLFSPAPAGFGGAPNSRVGVVDLGLPGVLPALNARAVELAVRAALALEGAVQPRSRFDRKNYFYPDLPKGYQISQYESPFCRGGRVPLGDGRFGQLDRIHMEEDAGKSSHDERGTLVDLNRAGVALCEVVGQPDLRCPADAAAFLESLRSILRYARVSDCDMEKGSLRCDANISMRANGGADAQLGTKVEIKNLNSIKMVQRALEYEQRRQGALLAAGHSVAQETRLWNEEKGETASMRGKEEAHDYRYFPDPDLPPLVIQSELVDRVRREMPELPDARRARYRDAFGLSEYDVAVLTADVDLGDWFEALVTECGPEVTDAPKRAVNWVMTEVQRTLREAGHQSITEFEIDPPRLAGLLRAEATERISHQAAKRVFDHMVANGSDADAAIAALGLEQIRDLATLQPVVDAVLAANPGAVTDYRSGKTKALHALKGLCMKETRGRADPGRVEQLLLTALGTGDRP